MPTLSRWLIRTALICGGGAFLVGLALAIAPLRTAYPALAAAGPSYIHLLVVGWITQLIMGVAYWMFPRVQRHPAPSSDWPGWIVYGSLNIGLACRLIGEPMVGTRSGGPAGWLLPMSAALQLIAMLTFVMRIWPRVRTR